MMLKYTSTRTRRYLLFFLAVSAFVAFALNLRLFFGPRGKHSPSDSKWSELSFASVPEVTPSPTTPEAKSPLTDSPANPPPSPTPSPVQDAGAVYTPTPEASSSSNKNHDACAGYDKSSSLVIALKTGATEALARVPPSLLTFLQCAGDNLLLFSDMEQTIGEHHIYDSLNAVVPEAIINNTDFTLYHDQKSTRLMGATIDSLKNRGPDAWKLDKYKNIHIAQKAWAMRPGKDWYFFIDADTYIFYPTLFAFLKRHSPSDKLYFGSAVWIGRPPYAHGGSGYILSKAAMRELVGDDAKAIAEKSDLDTMTKCCGDEAIAKVLSEDKDINITNIRPVIQGAMLSEIEFGPKRWCQPVITMHHCSPEEINDLWAWEQTRKEVNKPITFSELSNLVVPHLHSNLSNYHSGAWETSLTPPQNDPQNEYYFKWMTSIYKSYHNFEDKHHWRPWKTLDTCREACLKEEDCLTYVHHGTTCWLSRNFRLGRGREGDGEGEWQSGWEKDRIDGWRKSNGCEEVNWNPDNA